MVDSLDLLRLIESLGLPAAISPAAARADLDRDGAVTAKDLALLTNSFGSPAGVVPASDSSEWILCDWCGTGIERWIRPGERCPGRGECQRPNIDDPGDEIDPDDLGDGSPPPNDPDNRPPPGCCLSPPPPDNPPPACAFDITGPKFIGILGEATFSAGAGDVVWKILSGSQFIDPDNSDLADGAVSTNQSIRLTALADPGAVTIEARVTVDGQECVRTHALTIGTIKLKSVTFGGPRHNITQDTGQAYPSTDHWLDDDLDGNATNMDGDRRIPIAYTRGATVVIDEVRFAVEPPDADLGDVPIRGAGPDGQFFEATASMQGGELVATALTATQPLPNTVRFYNPYTIGWALALDNAGEVLTLIGMSDNRVYVTLNDPEPVEPLLGGAGALLYESVIDVAVRNTDGLTDLTSIILGIYNDFTDRSVARKAMDGFNKPDGEVLQYWAPAGNPINGDITAVCQSMSTMLDPDFPNDPRLQSIGTCTAWADFLKNTLVVHGVPTVKRLVVRSAYANGNALLLVKNWQFNGQGSLAPYCPDTPFIGPYDPSIVSEAPFVQFNELTDLPGVPGQNNANPPARFNLHWIVGLGGQVSPDGIWITGALFDPSYGTGPFTHIGWENASIAGHAFNCAVPPDADLPAELVNLGSVLGSRIDIPGFIETRFTDRN